MNTDFLHTTAQSVRTRSKLQQFDLAIVLGSGFDFAPELFNTSVTITYSDLPGLPQTSVSGHPGQLLCGTTNAANLLIFKGRFHLYEGHSAWQSTSHIRLAAALGCRQLLLTSAVGGINSQFRVGDFMWVSDHLNLSGGNPLTGVSKDPFIDLASLYYAAPYQQLRDQMQHEQIILHKGVLGVMPGPSYETPAEVRMLRTLGADAVGMSIAPEAIMARYLGLQVMALSRITNPAAGLGTCPLSHDEVLSVAAAGKAAGNVLLNQLVKQLLAPHQLRPSLPTH